MGKGTTTTNASTTSAAPQATQAYSNLLTQAQGVASTPYQAYTGELTAPVNAQQQAGISGINAAAGQAQPGLAAANNQAIASSAPITGQTIQNYQNPYTQQVVNATEAQINNQNQQQQSQLLGNQISQGALGGNRVGVAQANLGAQQSLANNSTLAGLYSNSYQQALAAAQNQQQTGLAGANAQANFAVQGQNAALTGAGAQLGAGTVEQQTQQATDTANQQAYAQAQAYPFQTTQWLAGIDTGVAPGLGSSSTGQTTAPPPNQTAQYLGAGLTAASFLARGGGVGGAHFAHGGGVQHFDGGGVAKTPWGSAPSWVPQIGMGSAAPHAGSAPAAANTTTPAFDYSKIIAANNKDSNGLLSGPSYGGGNVLTDSYGGSSSNPLPGLDASDYGAGFARGGIASARLRFADGGAPDNQPVPGVGAAVWNPDEPFRMPDQAAVDAWRAGTPVPPLGTPPVAQSDDDVSLPPEVTSGASKPPAGVGGADAQPMAFAPGQPTSGPTSLAPTAPTQTTAPDNGGGLGLLNLSHNARSGLLAAGLGMLASRSPNFGNAIGEGGLAGAAAYGAGEERDRKVADEAAKLSREAQNHAEEMKLKQGDQDLKAAVAPLVKDKNGNWVPNQALLKEKAQEKDLQDDKVKYDVIGYDAAGLPIKGFVDTTNKKLFGADGKPFVPPAGSKPTPETASAVANPLTDGTVAANAKQAAVPFNYSRSSPVVEKGLDVPDPAPIAGKSTDSIKSDAEMYLQTGKLPPIVARGQSPVAVLQNDYRTAVQNYANAKAASLGMTPEKMVDMWRTAPGMLKFVNGPDGRATVSLGTAVRHLDTLKQYIDAFNASDAPRIRQLQAVISREFGQDAATNIDAASAIVGPEIVKAIGIAGAGTRDERLNAESLFRSGSSQAKSAITVVERLLSGQLEGKERQARNSGVTPERFQDLIGPRPYEILKNMDKGASATGGFNPPDGALPGKPDKNGKVWYYDPNTKQPYPGQ